MEYKLNLKVELRLIGMALLCAILFSSSPALAQDVEAPQFRSRSEHLAHQRQVEQTYPELVRALRTLHLAPEKIAEAKTKLRRSEADTRATRQELQVLEEENKRQGYSREATSVRADELRASLKQSTDQLESELKNLLTPQQREQFDRHLQKQNRRNPRKEKNR